MLCFRAAPGPGCSDLQRTYQRLVDFSNRELGHASSCVFNEGICIIRSNHGCGNPWGRAGLYQAVAATPVIRDGSRERQRLCETYQNKKPMGPLAPGLIWLDFSGVWVAAMRDCLSWSSGAVTGGWTEMGFGGDRAWRVRTRAMRVDGG